ncbi:STAS domain-containing protein [Halobacillus locisalis]|uniref:STAS domain-containing protein n=1 Tax=Halobacillus locisalis TaxID=220753 RepID=A0A838CXS2_9BACI|nr:STAS domain-containing protein [Halobacillus locisalis]MBA2176396.1 STAS domain-containing protein [Halobacillus locisalis]
MLKNEELRTFLLNKAEQLTEEWYETLDKSGTGVYASKDPNVIKNLKAQNFEFHQHLSNVFTLDQKEFLDSFKDWIYKIGSDPQHLETPTHDIMREFLRVRDQYLAFIEEYIQSLQAKPSRVEIDKWKKEIIDAIDYVLMGVVEEKSNSLSDRIEKQKDMINELSSPLIQLSDGRALLPLVGDINSDRAAAILDNTLQGCTEKSIDHLFIDLSGVYLVDTMVAQQIFHLLKGLDLIGVTSTLSGIRPEIAQMATQLGIDFGKVSITNTLATAFSLDPIYNK